MTAKQHQVYKNFHEVTHPLLQHKLSQLRSKSTTKKIFAELAKEITMFLVYDATVNLPITTTDIHTPLETFKGPVLKGKKPVIFPILRAGIGMVDGFLSLMPAARVGHIGLYRDEETLEPHCYFFKIPLSKNKERHFFVCDPMLATGGSASAAITRLKAEGVKHITFVCLVAAPDGAARLYKDHPDVPVYAASLDRELNSKGYILPGLGDAGDRLFGIK